MCRSHFSAAIACFPFLAQGLLGRPDWDATRRTPFAQIPCGSGNALAASVGLWTVDTAVHAVVKGHQRAFDVASGEVLAGRTRALRSWPSQAPGHPGQQVARRPLPPPGSAQIPAMDQNWQQLASIQRLLQASGGARS